MKINGNRLKSHENRVKSHENRRKSVKISKNSTKISKNLKKVSKRSKNLKNDIETTTLWYIAIIVDTSRAFLMKKAQVQMIKHREHWNKVRQNHPKLTSSEHMPATTSTPAYNSQSVKFRLTDQINCRCIRLVGQSIIWFFHQFQCQCNSLVYCIPQAMYKDFTICFSLQ